MKIIVTRPTDPQYQITVQAPVNPETGTRFHCSAEQLIKQAEVNKMRLPGDNIQVIEG